MAAAVMRLTASSSMAAADAAVSRKLLLSEGSGDRSGDGSGEFAGEFSLNLLRMRSWGVVRRDKSRDEDRDVEQDAAAAEGAQDRVFTPSPSTSRSLGFGGADKFYPKYSIVCLQNTIYKIHHIKSTSQEPRSWHDKRSKRRDRTKPVHAKVNLQTGNDITNYQTQNEAGKL